MKDRSLADYFKISLRGIAMGAADVVPGVSGGTIAFITGIYEELIDSINGINLSLFKSQKENGLKGVWADMNGPFLLSLFVGIGIGIVSLAKGIVYLMEVHPIPLWSFFFGLIIASVIFIGRQIEKWNAGTIIGLLAGTIIAYYITIATPVGGSISLPYVFLTGTIAICAMILPGISGSFIALLMGSYKTVFGALGNLTEDPSNNIPTVVAFMAGAVVGLLTFARVLKWLFKHYRNLTLALLTGFMIGSLNKIWPWKEVTEYRTNSHGEQVPFLERSISPDAFERISGADPQLLLSLVLIVVGMAVILIMAKLAPSEEA